MVAHGPGTFTGELNILSGRRGFVRIRAGEPSEVIEIDREQLLALVQTDGELSDILMRAFILRRLELIARGIGDVVLIGSSHSLGTFRIKEFLTRNGHPYSYIDLDRDADVQELLDRFNVAVTDLPVLICRGQVVLRNPANQQIADCLGFNEGIDQTHAFGASKRALQLCCEHTQNSWPSKGVTILSACSGGIVRRGASKLATSATSSQ